MMIIRPNIRGIFSLRKSILNKRWKSSHGSISQKVDLSEYKRDLIRNFGIIAHVDHGKTTLADRILEITNTIFPSRSNRQVLDKLNVEKERGITVKAQTVSLFQQHKSQKYLLNLIDTPGHVDFSYEVSRSLAACQGILLVIDASQGIQAQTLANFYLAKEQNLAVIPILNKIDLPHANIQKCKDEIEYTFDIDREDVIAVSAKSGKNIDKVISAVIERIPPPSLGTGHKGTKLRSLLFDAYHDTYKGITCLMAIDNGKVSKGDIIKSHYSGKEYEVNEVGIMRPPKQILVGSEKNYDYLVDLEGRLPVETLYEGQVGYILSTMKGLDEARVGDTFYLKGSQVDPFSGFKPMKSMIFAAIYPTDGSMFRKLSLAIQKLILSDSSVTARSTSSPALGLGFHIGCLGMLHLDVFRQRLESEFFGEKVILTNPCVGFKLISSNGKDEKFVEDPRDFPSKITGLSIEEPFVRSTLIIPESYLGPVMTLCENRRGKQLDMDYLSDDRILMTYQLPLTELAQNNFFNELKQVSSGFASFDYKDDENSLTYLKSDMVKLDIALNGEIIDALALVCHKSAVNYRARTLVENVKNILKRDLFEIRIQALANGKPVARETLSALRKDVTSKLYGGDQTRKRKLLDKQKEGKKRMKRLGKVQLPFDAFIDLVSR